MSVSLIGKDGAAIATLTTNPVPVQLSTVGDNRVTFSPNDFTIDSFERLRVSMPTNVFEYTFGSIVPATVTTIWETGTVGTASTDALTSNLYGTNIGMPVNTTSGRWYQSINHIRYAPGISTTFRFTFNHGVLTANQRDRVGMFTDQGTFPSTAGDGVFYENDASAAAFVRRYMTQGVAGGEERVLRANWNLNKCDGTGDVADSTRNVFTLDFTKAQHLVIEFQYLGVGTIRFGWETGANGIVWAHEMHSVNGLAEAWARTGSLPVRVESYNYGVALTHNFTLINCVVQQEGNPNDIRGWRYFSGDSGNTGKLGGTAVGLYPLLGMRPIGTNDLTKRARFSPTSITICVAIVGVPTAGATPIRVSLLMLGTPGTGATFAVNTAGSAVSIDNAATATTAITGSAIWTGYVPNVVGTYTFDLSQMARENVNVVGAPVNGTQAINGVGNLYIAAGPVTTAWNATACTLHCGVQWKEII
jgi:hypothetical protein